MSSLIEQQRGAVGVSERRRRKRQEAIETAAEEDLAVAASTLQQVADEARVEIEGSRTIANTRRRRREHSVTLPLPEVWIPPPPPRARAARVATTGASPSGTATGASISVTTQVDGNKLGLNEFRKEIVKCIETRTDQGVGELLDKFSTGLREFKDEAKAHIEETTHKALTELRSSIEETVNQGVQEIEQENRHKMEMKEKTITIGHLSEENQDLKLKLQETKGELNISQEKYTQLQAHYRKLFSDTNKLHSDMAKVNEKNSELITRIDNQKVSMCTVCYAKQINMIATPCHHASFCQECCDKYAHPREGYTPPTNNDGSVRCPHCNASVTVFHQVIFCSI